MAICRMSQAWTRPSSSLDRVLPNHVRWAGSTCEILRQHWRLGFLFHCRSRRARTCLQECNQAIETFQEISIRMPRNKRPFVHRFVIRS